MGLNFGAGATNEMVNRVIKKADDTEMDHKKRDIPLDQIDMNKDNEYIFGYSDIDFLAKEIEESGFHGAIEVYAMPDGRYEIMSGHRRYLACKKLGYSTIPCIVSEITDPATIAEQIIMSNIHHRDMTPLRMARAIQYYSDNVLKEKKKDYQGKKRNALAEKFNMSERNIHRYLGILKLIPELQELCDSKSIPYTYLTDNVVQCSENVQRKLYERLLQLAPDGKIEELSKKMIEMQLESIKAEEERIKEAQKRKVEPFDDAGRTERKVPAPDDIGNNENKNYTSFVGYGDGNEEVQNVDKLTHAGRNMDAFPKGGLGDDQDVPENSHSDGNGDKHLDNDELDETVENKVKYHIDRIEQLVEEDAKYQDVGELVSRLRRVADMLEEQK